MGGGRICRSGTGGRSFEPSADQTGGKVCRQADGEHPGRQSGLGGRKHKRFIVSLISPATRSVALPGLADILDPHIVRSEARMRQHPVVLRLRPTYVVTPNRWASPMRGCGHANPRWLTARVRESAKVCAARAGNRSLTIMALG